MWFYGLGGGVTPQFFSPGTMAPQSLYRWPMYGGTMTSGGFGMQPQGAGITFAPAGLEPAGTRPGAAAAGTGAVLVPSAAVPAEARLQMLVANGALSGATDAVLQYLLQTLSELPDTDAPARNEIATLINRAMDFRAAGDFQKALLQAEQANRAIEMYKARIAR